MSPEAILRVEAELKTALREIGAAGYDRGYGDAAAGRSKPPGRPPSTPADRGPGDAVQYLQSDVAARAYARGFDDHFRGASRNDAAGRRLRVDYVKVVTAVGENDRAALRYAPPRPSATERSPRAVPAAADASPADRVGDRHRDTGPSR